jgi:CxxC-x17-CxxC domain-containing protein
MHKAICSTCGKDCEVPFRPTGDKPIYCNDCFSANRGGDRGGDRFLRKDFGARAPMRSNFGSTGSSQVDSEIKKQLEFLGMKIDRLTKTIENMASTKTVVSKEKSAEVKEALKDIAISEEVKVKTKTPVKKVVKKVTKKSKV